MTNTPNCHNCVSLPLLHTGISRILLSQTQAGHSRYLLKSHSFSNTELLENCRKILFKVFQTV
ncbi:classical arabinogalactan protein 4 [Iris pallida]|uniref:Classical arabinogalactan protein 4 n=1 Tax=Iris pallida TaxID=29817 RepID=A0AAX6ECV1_IRIPA|nr:classical arabinogalactan protein 4 [Iris pallida]